jgi:hypothetical protein
MRRDDVRFAAAARDDGLRKISKFTWRAGAAGVVFSAAIAAAFGHHVATQPPTTVHGGAGGVGSSGTGGSGSGSTAGTGSGSTGSGSTGSGSTGSGSTGGSGTSHTGGTGSSSGGSGGGQGTIVVPAQPPAPASGGGQVTSGGT